jgi:copper chaperone CopZ
VEAAVDGDLDVLRFEVRGMHCASCVTSVTRALSGVAEVQVLIDEGTATLRGRDVSKAEAAAAVRSLGFEVREPDVVASR